MYKHIILLLLFSLLFSCTKENKLNIDVSDIDVVTVIKRFDQEFYNGSVSELPELKNNYPYLFPYQNHDSVWVNKMQNKDEQELFAETQKLYNNFNAEKEQLTYLFKHVKYYYPNFKTPKVITILSNVDYERKVIYADSLLLISLDVYLGADSNIYEDFPDYIKNNFTKDHLIVDVAAAFSNVQIPPSSDRTFVSRIIQEGKKMYLLDAYLPKLSDAEKIGYTQEQIDWAIFNDEDIWKYFVQNKMLFSSDPELSKRFIDKAPFSKFFQANDNDTPSSIGVWFGWQIVRAYMQNNNTSLQKLLKTNNEDIFQKSKYKPTK
jgi:gliding motility-associated lipoprotein GldB